METAGPEIIETDTNPTVRYRGRFLYNRKDPKGSVEKRLELSAIQPNTLVFIPSPLLFYGFGKLVKKIPKGCHILCVEADQELMAFSAEHLPDFYRGMDPVTFIRADREEQILAVLSDLGPCNYRRAQLLPLSGGYSINADIYKRMFSALEKTIQSAWQNRMTSIHMASLWFGNLFKNIGNMASTQQRIPPLVQTKPVVVTGAGLSLEGSIPTLQKYRDRFFLLTVDTALPVLEHNGIRPDGICVMEGQMYNQYDFIGSRTLNALLFADITSFPGTLRLFTGPRYLFLSEFTESPLFDRMRRYSILPELVPPLGSIGVTALYIAKQITRGAVIFTGLDFAYTLGKTHANGAPAHTLLLKNADRKTPPVPYIACLKRPRFRTSGKMRGRKAQVMTDLVLHSYLGPLNDVIGNDDRCYDFGLFGAANKARLLTTESEFLSLIDTADSTTAESNERRRDGNDADISLENVRQFISEEIKLLQEAIAVGTRYITKDQSEKSSEAVVQALRAVDYIYLHFPDKPPLPRKEVGFVKRAVISTGRYLKILQNSLNMV